MNKNANTTLNISIFSRTDDWVSTNASQVINLNDDPDYSTAIIYKDAISLYKDTMKTYKT